MIYYVYHCTYYMYVVCLYVLEVENWSFDTLCIVHSFHSFLSFFQSARWPSCPSNATSGECAIVRVPMLPVLCHIHSVHRVHHVNSMLTMFASPSTKKQTKDPQNQSLKDQKKNPQAPPSIWLAPCGGSWCLCQQPCWTPSQSTSRVLIYKSTGYISMSTEAAVRGSKKCRVKQILEHFFVLLPSRPGVNLGCFRIKSDSGLSQVSQKAMNSWVVLGCFWMFWGILPDQGVCKKLWFGMPGPLALLSVLCFSFGVCHLRHCSSTSNQRKQLGAFAEGVCRGRSQSRTWSPQRKGSSLRFVESLLPPSAIFGMWNPLFLCFSTHHLFLHLQFRYQV